ncbi:MAG: hypothetical protein Q8Q14_13880 [Gemmatimonadales bacterium]|nr:hypothetical protein [Gemmatimonadales bacterium]
MSCQAVRASGRLAVVLLVACTPATTRPPFTPFPESLRAILNAPPARVVEEARAWLVADSVAVRFASPRDAFLETAELAGAVTLRVWADPDVPGKARVAIETVYRPMDDPSREARDLERAVPAGSDGQRLADRLMAALVEKFGMTRY